MATNNTDEPIDSKQPLVVGSLAEFVNNYLDANNVPIAEDAIIMTLDEEDVKKKGLVQIGQEIQEQVTDDMSRSYIYVTGFNNSVESLAVLTYLAGLKVSSPVRITSNIDELCSWLI